MYVDITNAPADSKEILTSLEKKSREIRGWSNYLVVVGDDKTCQHLTELKCAYGKELSWLLPFPGDCMQNFQTMLFKGYDASLKDITQKCGFKAITLTSLPIGELHTCSLCRLVKQYQCMLSASVHHHNEVNLHSFPSNNFLSVHIEAITAVQLEECHKYSIPSHVRGIFTAITNIFLRILSRWKMSSRSL